jgi:ribonucleoside-triphosphate reductase
METRSLEVIDRDIERVKKELGSVRGSETEVYARIVGYYRSVRNWNKGKKDEFKRRKEFVMSDGAYALTEADTQSCCGAARLPKAASPVRSEAPARYEVYSRKTCPNCPAVRDFLDSCALSGTLIDVDTPDGIRKAATNGVFAAPTVIMYDDEGNEVVRAHNKTELASVMAAAG